MRTLSALLENIEDPQFNIWYISYIISSFIKETTLDYVR